jgi:hypothetical protein
MNVLHTTLLSGFLAGMNAFFAVQGGDWWWMNAIASVTLLVVGYQGAMLRTQSLSQAVSLYITAILAAHGIKNTDLPHEKKELRTP